MDQPRDQTKDPEEMLGSSDLMRARHPDLFSDTIVEEVERLPKPVFEYHLDSLTSRKQEYEFEYFCRKLAEKEICPNLRPQTGPTGGGDSKVDTETYPVAEEIALRWWSGFPAAGAERWAFAFSAKKAWKTKVVSDLNNILSTGRDYTVIYFFSNQFIRDKDRAAFEDKLSKDSGAPVRIVDRAWIVEKVYESGHLDLAISTLNIEGIKRETTNRTGPLDTERLTELEELDQQVIDVERYQGARYQLVEDCLRAAILARSLERPRTEVEGRFLQAHRLAENDNYRPQLLRIAYNRAWTAHWWYDDYHSFTVLYDEVEQHAEESDEAHEIQLLVNLWLLLPPAVVGGRLAGEKTNIDERTSTLKAILNKLVANAARPTNGLRARTNLTLMKITRAFQFGQPDDSEAGWLEMQEIAELSSSFPSYPIEQLFELTTELGKQIDSPTFDTLYAKLADILGKRRSDGAAGQAYAERGLHKLQQGKAYEAIRWFGRAEELLLKEEYEEALIRALLGSSFAFEGVGLFWAARNKLLAAADRSLGSFLQRGKAGLPALVAIKRLVWIELQLGRIPELLNLIRYQAIIASHVNLGKKEEEAYQSERSMQDAVLGIHLLNVPPEKLPSVTRLPDALERLGLLNARMALLFVLGHEAKLREEGYIPPDKEPGEIQDLVEVWHGQDAARDIPSEPLLVDGPVSDLRSVILGMEIVFEVSSNPLSLGIAESLLGVLEAFLATSFEQDVLPYRERMTLTVGGSENPDSALRLHFSDDDNSVGRIEHPKELEFANVEERKEFVEWLYKSMIDIVSRTLLAKDTSDWLERVAGEERGVSRALSLGDILTLSRSFFGEERPVRLRDWQESEDQEYAVTRKAPWKKENETTAETRPQAAPKFGVGRPPRSLKDKSRIKHTDHRVLSPIDIALWDRANWRGTLFAWPVRGLPMIGIGFDNEETGKVIFENWRKQLGDEDKNDVVRVAIIRGLSKSRPFQYAVVIGANVFHLKSFPESTFTLISRINRMSPRSDENLINFLQWFEQHKAFLLAPASLEYGPRELFPEFSIRKQQIAVRQAWQIGENDPDRCVLAEDDDPIVPDGVVDPPVYRALERIRSQARG